eukprot:gene38790-50986_t
MVLLDMREQDADRRNWSRELAVTARREIAGCAAGATGWSSVLVVLLNADNWLLDGAARCCAAATSEWHNWQVERAGGGRELDVDTTSLTQLVEKADGATRWTVALTQLA